MAKFDGKGARWYADQINSLMGIDWAMFLGILGGRMTGKSYAVIEWMVRRKLKKGKDCKLYWLRISETSTKMLLANKANKLIDPDLVRKYDLDLSTKGMDVYNHLQKGEKNPDPLITVLPLSAMGKTKGVAFYDKDFTGDIIIALDEFQLEQGEKRTSFDILYNFIGQLENIARTRKNNVKILLIGNTLEEASTILKAFNFLPQGFGRFKLKRKRCVIDNIAPTEEYLKDREGSIADILGGKEMSNYTNELKKDTELINKKRLKHLRELIKFERPTNTWYCVWEDNTITRYKKGLTPPLITPMRPYLSTFYAPELRDNIINLYDARAFKFDSLITQSYFEGDLQKLRKQ